MVNFHVLVNATTFVAICYVIFVAKLRVNIVVFGFAYCLCLGHVLMGDTILILLWDSCGTWNEIWRLTRSVVLQTLSIPRFENQSTAHKRQPVPWTPAKIVSTSGFSEASRYPNCVTINSPKTRPWEHIVVKLNATSVKPHALYILSLWIINHWVGTHYTCINVNVNVTDTISWRCHHDRVMQLNWLNLKLHAHLS